MWGPHRIAVAAVGAEPEDAIPWAPSLLVGDASVSSRATHCAVRPPFARHPPAPEDRPLAASSPTARPTPASTPTWMWVGVVVVSGAWAVMFHTDALSLLAAGAIVGVALFAMALAARRNDQAPSWQAGTDIWLALPVLAVHLAVSYLAIPIATAILPLVGDQAVALVATATTQLPAWLVALVSAMVVAPMEEDFWRGTVQPRIGKRADGLDMATDRVGGTVSWRAILLTTAVFGLFHVPTLNIPLVGASLLGGIAWGWLRARTGGMVAPVLAHGGWTATMALVPPI